MYVIFWKVYFSFSINQCNAFYSIPIMIVTMKNKNYKIPNKKYYNVQMRGGL